MVAKRGNRNPVIRALDWFLNAVIVVLILLGIFVAGPEIETRWFPAYSRFEVLKIEPHEKGSKVTVRYSKFRDCIPQGYAWYLGDLGDNMRQLTVSANLTAPSLPIGRHTSTQIIEVTPEEFAGSLYAEVFSKCHPFWITRSVVFQ